MAEFNFIKKLGNIIRFWYNKKSNDSNAKISMKNSNNNNVNINQTTIHNAENHLQQFQSESKIFHLIWKKDAEKRIVSQDLINAFNNLEQTYNDCLKLYQHDGNYPDDIINFPELAVYFLEYRIKYNDFTSKEIEYANKKITDWKVKIKQ